VIVLELKQLRLFVGVAEELHFGRAATRLFITQPALSRQIRALEQTLGVELFVRTGRRVRLTAPGAALLEHARAMLADAEAAEIAVRGTMAAAPPFHVGFATLATLGPMPRVLRTFHRIAPGVSIRMRVARAGALLEAVRSSAIDVGFLDQPADGGTDLVVRPISREPLLLAVPVRHPLARTLRRESDATDADALLAMSEAAGIAVGTLADEPFVSFPRAAAPSVADAIERAFRTAGVRPRIAHEAESLLGALGIVAAEMGVTFVPAALARIWPDDIAYATLRDPEPIVELGAVWRRDGGHPALPRLAEAIDLACGSGVEEFAEAE
jgi:DNA-binding transcriptional LysR family regulator